MKLKIKKKNTPDLTVRNAKHYNNQIKLLWGHVHNIRNLLNNTTKILCDRIEKLEKKNQKVRGR